MVVVEIETPENKDDYEDISWYLYHPGISVFIEQDEDNPEEDQWNVRFDSKCMHLNGNGKCNAYDEKPPICTEYSIENCDHEFNDMKVHFKSPEEYKEWLKTCEEYQELCKKEEETKANKEDN
ncbi:MAG: hypothetical protein KKE98_06425 [Nanoarchaeota archaeon]|nr:hypothetical protein [Nanoarchaeota archaeon]MBU1598049.1 hypothetical protein [Nanoarchaeota archaeon]MBU2442054.1 hypothetical protein [Nanoarchaeota archaeon]